MPQRNKKYAFKFSDKAVAEKAMDDLFKMKKVVTDTIRLEQVGPEEFAVFWEVHP